MTPTPTPTAPCRYCGEPAPVSPAPVCARCIHEPIETRSGCLPPPADWRSTTSTGDTP